MKHFTLTITSLDNASFGGGESNKQMFEQIADILQQVVKQVRNGELTQNATVYICDVNGNRVGGYVLQDK